MAFFRHFSLGKRTLRTSLTTRTAFCPTHHIIEPEIIEDTEENLMELEKCSEFPIIADMTTKCTYSNYGEQTWMEIAKLPSILDAHDVYG